MSSLSLGHTSAKDRTRDPYSALVVTVVHNPEDARIRQRQVNAVAIDVRVVNKQK